MKFPPFCVRGVTWVPANIRYQTSSFRSNGCHVKPPLNLGASESGIAKFVMWTMTSKDLVQQPKMSRTWPSLAELNITYGSLTTLLITCLPQHCWRIYISLYNLVPRLFHLTAPERWKSLGTRLFFICKYRYCIFKYICATTPSTYHWSKSTSSNWTIVCRSWLGFVKNNSVDTDVYLHLSNRLVW